jgi:hypothetical protein
MARLAVANGASLVAARRLIVFVKAPRAGVVKTRLASAIGPEAACHAYERLVAVLLANLRRLDAVQLRYAPEDAAARVQIEPWCRPGWSLAPQGGGDLGARLDRAFYEEFTGGAQHVVVVGSDCPEVLAEDIEAGWEGLEEGNDVVLGPAVDGGYWLIGLSRRREALFTDIPWSTERVFGATLERARASGCQIRLLRTLADVDTVEDWNRFERRN